MTRKLASSISKPFKIIYSGNHYKHDPQLFFSMGRMEKFPEMPSRIEMIKSSLVERGFTDFLSFKDFGYDPIYSVHAVEYVEYLKTAYPKWTERGGDAHGVAPDIFATRLKEVFGKHDVDHSNIFDQAANFNMDCSAVIAKDTYQVVYEGAQCSITGAYHVLNTKESVLVLTRPPGHHSARDLAGGFCFLNNAAIAAEYLVRSGANVTILDLDYHHGNGTQSIFWERSNPICISLHGKGDYPYFTGYAEEIGKGRGVGCNHNVPLPHGTSNELYLEVLRNTIHFKIMPKRPDYLVISLGVDTFAGDPIGTFKLTSSAFLEIGKVLAGINVPTLFVMEGGYAVEAIGTNVANEIPSRIEIIKDALIAHNLVEFISRNDYGLSPLLEVHTREYIQYLEQAYSLWIDKGGDVNGVIPEVFAVALQQVYHEDSALNSSNFYAQAARFTFDTAAPIAEHTFKTVYEGAQCALTCAEILMATRSPTFALIRPPGHHSSQSLLGGFCFVNNVAVAAEYIIQRHHKVAILDVDYHAGNGTQDIYYTRKNPLFCSIHGENDYPYLWGSSGEIGSKDGKGFNYNFPLPFGTGDELYLKTLNDVINTVIRPYRPDFLLISLGVDTYSGDPVGTFNVSSEGFWEIGRSIGSLQLPTLFVMEGGYAVNEIGENVSNVFRGFLSSNVP